jgi:hypothetical protein
VATVEREHLAGPLRLPDLTSGDHRADLFGGCGERGGVAEQHPVVARPGHEAAGVPEPLDDLCEGR